MYSWRFGDVRPVHFWSCVPCRSFAIGRRTTERRRRTGAKLNKASWSKQPFASHAADCGIALGRRERLLTIRTVICHSMGWRYANHVLFFGRGTSGPGELNRIKRRGNRCAKASGSQLQERDIGSENSTPRRLWRGSRVVAGSLSVNPEIHLCVYSADTLHASS